VLTLEIDHSGYINQLRALVDISSPSGDYEATNQAQNLLAGLLPNQAIWRLEESSSLGYGKDLIAHLDGTGEGRLLLVGHIDTVHEHEQHRPLYQDGDIVYGSGTYDMKAGLLIAVYLMRALSKDPHLYQRVTLLSTADEESRLTPLRYNKSQLSQYDACLCFEGGEAPQTVIGRRKGSAILFIEGKGLGAHSGVNPEEGHSALVALADLAQRLEIRNKDGLSVAPVKLHSGEHDNKIPDQGILQCDVRAYSMEAMDQVFQYIPEQINGVILEPRLQPCFPPMNRQKELEPYLVKAGKILDTKLKQESRGGSSDASHLSQHIPLTVDGLGPLGGKDHSPNEHILLHSVEPSLELSAALSLALLQKIS
jgi:glutamate carboxypeptidase